MEGEVLAVTVKADVDKTVLVTAGVCVASPHAACLIAFALQHSLHVPLVCKSKLKLYK